MSKVKIFFILIGFVLLYKGYIAFRDFEIGVGNKNTDYINFVLNQKKRSSAGVSVPANALFLYDIEYPDNIKHNVK